MVKRVIDGVVIPEVASNAELREFVLQVYDEYSSSYLAAATALDVNAATVWKLINREQVDSPIIREKWGIRKTPHRPRVWMPTNNFHRAKDIFKKHYPEVMCIQYRGTPHNEPDD